MLQDLVAQQTYEGELALFFVRMMLKSSELPFDESDCFLLLSYKLYTNPNRTPVEDEVLKVLISHWEKTLPQNTKERPDTVQHAPEPRKKRNRTDSDGIEGNNNNVVSKPSTSTKKKKKKKKNPEPATPPKKKSRHATSSPVKKTPKRQPYKFSRGDPSGKIAGSAQIYRKWMTLNAQMGDGVSDLVRIFTVAPDGGRLEDHLKTLRISMEPIPTMPKETCAYCSLSRTCDNGISVCIGDDSSSAVEGLMGNDCVGSFEKAIEFLDALREGKTDRLEPILTEMQEAKDTTRKKYNDGSDDETGDDVNNSGVSSDEGGEGEQEGEEEEGSGEESARESDDDNKEWKPPPFEVESEDFESSPDEDDEEDDKPKKKKKKKKRPSPLRKRRS
jgi:hypothetical protein